MAGKMSATDSNGVPDAELIRVIKEIGDPAVGTSEVAKRVSLTRTQVNNRLKKLEEEGILKSKRFGSGNGWWLKDRVS